MGKRLRRTSLDVHMEEILQRIKTKREELGLTQTDVATKLNMTYNGYFKVEKGYTKLDIHRFLEIALILDISPKELIGDSKPYHIINF